MMRKILGAVCGFAFAASALATPPNTPTLDGRPLEYDSGDPQAAYTGGGGAFGPGNELSNLYVTWDETYLYIALQGVEADNKLVVMLDVDPDAGTGATTTTNWSGVEPATIQYNDVGWKASDATNALAFGLDYQIASEGYYNNIVQILYDGVDTPSSNNVAVLFDEGNGSVPVGRAVDMAVQADALDCDLKGFEAKIAWSILYPQSGDAAGRFGTVGAGEVIPRGAKLRMFANIHNNNPNLAYSSNDAIPEQVSPNASWDAGLLITDTYLDIDLDADNDGFPDVAAGDVNAPYIRAAVGAQGSRSVYVYFNEPVDEASVTDENNWLVNGNIPNSATLVSDAVVLLDLADDLPAAGTVAMVSVAGVEDLEGNTRMASFCLDPTDGGLTNAVTVRFILDTASGLGISPGASNFFVNGNSFPLEFGYPPSTFNQLQPLSGSLYYRDVTFPPGTVPTLNYKYSAQLNNTGTNNYEAIRLQNYENATRKLKLPTNEVSLVVTDYLGAAAGPWRSGGDGYNELYLDANRGDAGVRERTTITFALDLNNRNLDVVDRVLIQGTDPLRGFNYSSAGEADWAGGNNVGWDEGGLELFDDGTHGDAVAGDGIYSRLWALTEDGTDAEVVPEYQNSLVAGDLSTLPYIGFNWEDRRTPRSMIYKFYVVKKDGSPLESPSNDIELYIDNAAGTNVVLSPFVWANDNLPLPPPSNSPTMDDSFIFAANGSQVVVKFENQPSELQHGILISTNLMEGWLDYGKRAQGTNGTWSSVINNANPEHEFYQAFAGPAKAPIGMYFEPNPLPATGGTLRVWYRQHGRALAGYRDIGLTGDWNGWGTAKPMTFVGDGAWYYDLILTGAAPAGVQFKARSVAGDWESGDNIRAYKGVGRATWTPEHPTNGEIVTITYDAAGGPLAAISPVYAHLGFDEDWFDTDGREMTNTGGSVWTLQIPVNTNAKLSMNFVFRTATSSIWDSEGNEGTGGRQYRVFLNPPAYP